MSADTRLPFAAVTSFSPEKSFYLNTSYSLKDLHAILDTALSNNGFAALRISGVFHQLESYCYEPQQKPYKAIQHAKKKKTHHQEVSGILVGFYTPGTASVINSPVYHFHFVNAQRNKGGHVQELEVKNVLVEIDYVHTLLIDLPDPSVMEIDLSKAH